MTQYGMSSPGFDGAKKLDASCIGSLSLASFKIHFMVLDHSGPDDAQMSSPFQVNLAETTVLGIR
ncbi:hypothetical protein B0H14DRAFT_3524627 [Mycena olivaceomarginata]|nr:hypothetical protein B0H14DRAFT_3524627 [Mycena olivaceomarginata]